MGRLVMAGSMDEAPPIDLFSAFHRSSDGFQHDRLADLAEGCGAQLAPTAGAPGTASILSQQYAWSVE